MRRTKKEAQQTRDEIFRAGIKVFARHGYQAATLSKIACEAGVSRGAIYWHFKNKEGFFRETVQRLNRLYDELLEVALRQSGSAIDVIVESAAQILRRFVHDEEFRSMQELVIRIAIGHRKPLQLVRERDEQIDDRALELLRGAIANDQLCTGISAEVAYTAISAVMSGTFLMIIERGIHPSEDEIWQMAEFIGRGLAPHPTQTTVGGYADASQRGVS